MHQLLISKVKISIAVHVDLQEEMLDITWLRKAVDSMPKRNLKCWKLHSHESGFMSLMFQFLIQSLSYSARPTSFEHVFGESISYCSFFHGVQPFNPSFEDQALTFLRFTPAELRGTVHVAIDNFKSSIDCKTLWCVWYLIYQQADLFFLIRIQFHFYQTRQKAMCGHRWRSSARWLICPLTDAALKYT